MVNPVQRKAIQYKDAAWLGFLAVLVVCCRYFTRGLQIRFVCM